MIFIKSLSPIFNILRSQCRFMKLNIWLYYSILIIFLVSCKKKDSTVTDPNNSPIEYTYNQSYSNAPIIFSDFTKNISDNDLNTKQFLKPLWTTMGSVFNLQDSKKSNSWVGITVPIVNDFNNDGYQDLFISFMGSENESIPFKLFLYDLVEKKLLDKSNLINENIGQSFNRRAMCADLNGDKILDFVCVSHPEAVNMDLSYFDIILSEGGKWKQKRIKVVSRFKGEGYYHGFALGDLDNDGDVDIVTSMWHNPSQGITSYMNDSKGNFVEKKAIVLSGDNLLDETMSFTQELSDINNDNCLDLIYWGTLNTYIKFGNCDGTFGGSYLKLNQRFSWDYKFTDLNQDGLKDLVIFYSENERKIVLYQNVGTSTKPSFSKTKEIPVNFYTSYIDLKDLNNDGKIDILPMKFLDGNIDQNFTDGKTVGFFPNNEILLGQGGFNFQPKNYPILTPIEAIKFDLTSKKLQWTTTHLTNVDNPFQIPMTYQNLRGEIKDWIIYLSSSPIVNPSSSQVKKLSVPMNQIEKDAIGNNTFNYLYAIQNELLPITYIRVSYIDSNGLESNLSYEIKIERK
jgi:hypothetical protein